jgi:hypothetical protein
VEVALEWAEVGRIWRSKLENAKNVVNRVWWAILERVQGGARTPEILDKLLGLGC